MELSRRGLLMAAAGAALTLALPTQLLASKPTKVESLSFYVERIAVALGGEKLAPSLREFYEKADDGQKMRLDYVNGQMRRAGFGDFSRSGVYQVGGQLFYSAVFQDGFNVCMPFLALQQQADPANLRQPTTMVEGPTVVALALASEDMRKEVDLATAQALLVPMQRVSTSEGSFESGYRQPDYYLTRAGTVRIGYKRTARGKGRAYVTVVRGDTREVVFEKNYDIRYVSKV